ncbi:hypothetical protein JTB14_009004 [Gonioctena quinquepunctata]|nr:hypothetical protein JTB14_009004 [Gonioctena quinquepunctata]
MCHQHRYNKETVAVKGVPKHVTLHVCRVDKKTTVASLTALLNENFPKATSQDDDQARGSPERNAIPGMGLEKGMVYYFRSCYPQFI